MHWSVIQRVLIQGLGLVSAVGCPLQLLAGLEGLPGKSVFLDFNTASGGQSVSTYAASLRNRGSRASICPHAQYQVPFEDGTVSSTSLVPPWLRLTKVLGR